MKAVITVVGQDKVGIIASVSVVLAECGVNILDISQTTMQDMFTMIMMVDMSAANREFGAVAEELNKTGEKIAMTIRIQHNDIFEAMHKI